jgi:hypothetical protein
LIGYEAVKAKHVSGQGHDLRVNGFASATALVGMQLGWQYLGANVDQLQRQLALRLSLLNSLNGCKPASRDIRKCEFVYHRIASVRTGADPEAAIGARAPKKR